MWKSINNFLKYLLKSAAEIAFYKELHFGRKSYKTQPSSYFRSPLTTSRLLHRVDTINTGLRSYARNYELLLTGFLVNCMNWDT